MKLRSSVRSGLKIGLSNSIKLSLSLSLSFAPVLTHADSSAQPATNSATNTANSPNAAVTSPNQAIPVQRTKQLTEVEWALNGTAQTQQKNYLAALKALADNKPDEAKKYLVNGVTASSLANLMNAQINNQAFSAIKSQPNWLSAAKIDLSVIDDAEKQSSKQLPTYENLAPVTTNPPTVSYPALFATPGVNANYLNDSQVQKLSELMASDSDLRELLFESGQQRLMSVAAPDLGVNPPAYEATASVLPSSAVCSGYGWVCSALTGGGILTADFSQQMQDLKNLHYGVPLDKLADDIITKQAWIATGVGAVTRLFQDAPKIQTQSWMGQTAVDISPALALYYTTYMTMGQLAGLYNYPLSIGNKESLALVAMALARVVVPNIYYGNNKKGKNPDPTSPTNQLERDKLVNVVAKAMVYSRTHNQSIDKVLTSLGKKYPDVLQTLRGAMKSYAVAVPNLKLAKDESSKKATQLDTPTGSGDPTNGGLFPPSEPTTPDPGSGSGTNPGGSLPPGSGDLPPGGGDFPPGGGTGNDPGNGKPPGTEKPDPAKGKGVAVQMAYIGLAMAKGATYNYMEAEVLGQLIKALFKSSYEETRRLESENFRTFLLSGQNSKFLKLLVLSQSPGTLQLSPAIASSPTTPTLPTTTNPTGGIVTNPGTTAPTTGAANGNGANSNPGGLWPATGKDPVTTKGNPNQPFFPFSVDLAQPTQTKPANSVATTTRTFGGQPYKFILNFARSMKICSPQDVDNASKAVPLVKALVAKNPALSKYDDWDETEDAAQPGMLSAIFQPVASLLPFYRNSKMQQNIYDELKAKHITQKDVENILLIHDCFGRPDSKLYNGLLSEMISYSNFSDEDIGILRLQTTFSRLRMGETILQLLYLNGEPDQNALNYFSKVLKILALDAQPYQLYFEFYQAELKKAMYVPYTLSPTGYRLRNLHATNPYDITVMDEKRPDEPQIMTPIARPSNSNGVGGISGLPGYGSIPTVNGLGPGADPFITTLSPRTISF